MRPVKLTMSTFGPYVGRQEVDFGRLGAHGLFLIHGRTGSGKSTVLDAMCFALYGETSGAEREGRHTVSTYDPYGGTEVVFEFEHLGKRYKVSRKPEQLRPKLRGTGTTTQAHEAHLEDMASGKVLSAKASEVTSMVTDLLRCDAKQFRQTIVLPQGEFRKVVTDDGSRRKILANIFQTGRFQALVQALREKHNALMREGKANEEARQEVLSFLEVADRAGGDELLRLAQEAEAAALLEKKGLDSTRSKAQEAKTAAEALAGDFDELAVARRSFETLEERAADMLAEEHSLALARKAKGLTDAREHLASRGSERDDVRDELAAARKRSESAKGELESAREASAALEPERPRLEALAKEAARLEHLRPLVERAAAKRVEQGAAQERHERAALALKVAEDRVASLAGRTVEVRERLTAAGAVAGRLHDAKESRTSARAAVDAANELGHVTDELRAIRAELEEATAGDDALAAALAQITLQAPGLLANDLVAGKPCAVCGSPDHPAPAHGDEDEGLTRTIAEFGEEAARVATLKRRRDEAERKADELRAAHGWREQEHETEALRTALAEAEARVAAAEEGATEAETLAAELKGLEEEAAAAADEAKAATKAEREAGEALLAMRAEVAAVLSELPEDDREPDAFQLALEAAGQAHEELQVRFTAAAERLAEAERSVKDAAKEITSAEGRLATAEERLAAQRDRFEEQLTGAGFVSLEDLDAAILPSAELEERSVALEAYRKSRTETAAVIQRLEKKLKDRERPDVEELTEALEAAAQAAAAADQRWNTASKHAAAVQDQLKRYDQFLKKDADLEERKAAAKRLHDLATGRVAGAAKVDLETFVLRSIFHEVLLLGNRHLKHMTAGRYQLALQAPEDKSSTGLELIVIDSFSGGATRPAQTLSGGEGFLASLALALGLAEVAQQQSGAVEQGALFIDEGFGSLDSDSLDGVIKILRQLPEAHRMVGIISHVDELKKRVPVQLLVVGGDAGSRLEVRVNA